MGQEQTKIYYDSNNPKKLDLEYYDKIKLLSNVCLIIGILMALSSIISIIQASSLVRPLLSIPYVIYGVIFLFWGIYSSHLLQYRKPNAFFNCRSFIIITLISLIEGLFVSFSLIGLALIIVSVVALVYTFKSDDLEVFPKEYRHVGISDVLILIGAIALPITATIIVCAIMFFM